MFDRDEQELSQIIETGVKTVRSGKATLEQFLAQYPDQADEIRPEIAAALWLIASQREVETRPGFVASSRKRVLDRIKTEARDQGARRSFFGIIWPRQIALQWVVAAVFLVVVLTGAGGVVASSQAALPGDGLYAVKRISEQVAYTVTLNDVQRVQLSAQYSDRRLSEVENLMAKGSYQKAGIALQEFKQQLTKTIALLQNVSNSQAMPKLTAAVALREQLANQSSRLTTLTLMAGAPPDLRLSLQDALGEASLGASAATDVIKDIPEATLTMFPTFTGTELVIETPTPVPSDTPEPSIEPTDEVVEETPADTTSGTTSDDPTATDEDDSTDTPTIGPDGTPVPTEKPSKTPKPPKVVPTNSSDNSNKNTDPAGKGNDGKQPPGKNK